MRYIKEYKQKETSFLFSLFSHKILFRQGGFLC